MAEWLFVRLETCKSESIREPGWVGFSSYAPALTRPFVVYVVVGIEHRSSNMD